MDRFCGSSRRPHATSWPSSHRGLGEAIDPERYDYEAAVVWNWHAPALWNRFTVELVPVLAGARDGGSGYLNPGDVLLAECVEASIRVGREALRELRRGPPNEI